MLAILETLISSPQRFKKKWGLEREVIECFAGYDHICMIKCRVHIIDHLEFTCTKEESYKTTRSEVDFQIIFNSNVPAFHLPSPSTFLVFLLSLYKDWAALSVTPLSPSLWQQLPGGDILPISPIDSWGTATHPLPGGGKWKLGCWSPATFSPLWNMAPAPRCRATQWKSESVLACRQSHSPVTGELLPLCTLIFFRVCSPSLNIIGMALFEYLQNKPPSEEEKTFCCRCHCHAGNRTVTERRQTNSLRQCREKHSSLPSRIFDVTLLDQWWSI